MSDPAAAANLFLLLAMGHCLGDFALQSDRMAREKCPGCGETLGWGWWLTAHAGVHGLIVALITGIPLLGLGEWILHIGIDLCKCRRLTSLAADQALHLLAKAVWALLAVGLVGTPAGGFR